MAIRNCPVCKSEASTKVPACIRCGYRFEGHWFHIPKHPWHFVLDFGRSIIFSGICLGLLGAYFLFLMKHVLEAIFIFVAAATVLGSGLVIYFRGLFQQWRGGDPCQSCGGRDTRNWTDNGRKFSICSDCIEDLNS